MLKTLGTLDVRWLGLVPYREALALQESLVRERAAGAIGDTLLLLEHPPVLTAGRASRPESLRADPATLARHGLEMVPVARGGDVTWHGPGQIVGYPILDLKPDRQDVHRYVRDLEEVLIRVAADYGVPAGRVSGLTGVWVGQEKLAAIGVRISRWITSHGFALNLSPDLSYFDLIVPCGIADRGVTSLARLGCAADKRDVEDRIIAQFCSVFGCEVLPARVGVARNAT